jgi:phosphoserine phosphatase
VIKAKCNQDSFPGGIQQYFPGDDCNVIQSLADTGLSDGSIVARYFYSDSANDLPLPGAVSHPVAVNLGMRLTGHAQPRGWPIPDWRCA